MTGNNDDGGLKTNDSLSENGDLFEFLELGNMQIPLHIFTRVQYEQARWLMNRFQEDDFELIHLKGAVCPGTEEGRSVASTLVVIN